MKDIHKLKPKACRLVDLLVDGESHAKTEICAALDMTMNSTFFNLLTACKKPGIIQYDKKTIRLTDEMLKYEAK